MVQQSATLAINEQLRERRAAGKRVLHLAFGEAGLPVLPEVADVLARSVDRNSYEPVTGALDARRAGAGYFTRRGLPTEADQLILAPGSKPLLFALLAALDGDLVLPKPAWVSYAAQAALVGKRVHGVPIAAQAGGLPDPDALAETLRAAQAEGARPGVLLLTTPDNPTGTIAPPELVRQVCQIAEQYGLAVVSDEIYRDLAHEGHEVHSPALELPERTIVTAGLSKGMALGGYRIGFARLPDSPFGQALRDKLVGIASEVWSCLPGPMQTVAEYVLSEPEPVRAHIAASVRLHQQVVRACYAEFVAVGASCRPPQGGFYLYPDLSAGQTSGAEALAGRLLDEHDIGVLAGTAFGDDPSAARFRVATSLCYGETEEQRWTALRSDDPVALPWIAESIDQLRTALRKL
ncbi:aspartate aminotransferase [Tamaricihabitans halophyticus]|uniref:Aminotransferase n=1 Tax=Tamaricihabitans halophyticus TaxID=1262583 RepID=A0A4R2R5W8_9PSEU|nr:pyridoxal phosphate-dependent aminotransferase [Tamaricihabitans halophyticus]TCP57188.1 aspartate aminotransferase [Tamaricihabitans halophyticus]